MVETLLSPSNVLLYGRKLEDLQFKFVAPPSEVEPDDIVPPKSTSGEQACTLTTPPAPPRLGNNNFLQAQLADENAVLARIYAFSYEGHYYNLAKPAIFLVHGPGRDPEAYRPALDLPNARVDRAPADADRTGVASQDYSFSEDMRVWSYDKGDYSIRLEPDAGPFEQILLESELRTGGPQSHYSGKFSRLKMGD